jgi:hypothetical protein
VTSDFSPLRTKADRATVDRYKAEHEDDAAPLLAEQRGNFGAILFLAAGGLIVFLLNLVFGPSDSDPVLWWAVLIVTGFFALFGIVVGLPLTLRPKIFFWSELLQESNFAARNRMTFTPAKTDRDFDGVLFRIGDRRLSSRVFQQLDSPFAQFGNHVYWRPSGVNSSRVPNGWAYLTVPIAQKLPNAVLVWKTPTRQSTALLGDRMPLHPFGVAGYARISCQTRDVDALRAGLPTEFLAEMAHAKLSLEFYGGRLFAYHVNPWPLRKPTTIQTALRLAESTAQHFGTPLRATDALR